MFVNEWLNLLCLRFFLSELTFCIILWKQTCILMCWNIWVKLNFTNFLNPPEAMEPFECLKIRLKKLCLTINLTITIYTNLIKIKQLRCFESQCKPTYGACESSCDCVDKYNMRKGEGKCHNKQCLCRWVRVSPF